VELDDLCLDHSIAHERKRGQDPFDRRPLAVEDQDRPRSAWRVGLEQSSFGFELFQRRQLGGRTRRDLARSDPWAWSADDEHFHGVEGSRWPTVDRHPSRVNAAEIGVLHAQVQS
jgi:hypothetical protein